MNPIEYTTGLKWSGTATAQLLLLIGSMPNKLFCHLRRTAFLRAATQASCGSKTCAQNAQKFRSKGLSFDGQTSRQQQRVVISRQMCADADTLNADRRSLLLACAPVFCLILQSAACVNIV